MPAAFSATPLRGLRQEAGLTVGAAAQVME
jgi:hypothetical protein